MELLFVKQDLRHALESHKQSLKQQIEALEDNYLLKANEEELRRHFLEKFQREAPRLLRDSIYVDEPREVDVDVSGDPRYDWGGALQRGRATRKGTRVVIHVPFEGDAEFFKWQPSTYTMNPPRADISGSELLLTYDILEQDSGNLQQRYQRELDSIDQYLVTVRSQVEECLNSLSGVVSSVVSSRKARLEKGMGLVGALGLPVRRSSEQTISLALPKKRRPSPTPMPRVAPGPYQPEPVLDSTEYDHILDIVESLAVAIERSPSAFSHMGEEQLRDHILIQLNGHYEGQATGETFNASGKTDVLVRVNNKNVFIGECKFWGGAKAFLAALDQLFGYTCWSDTKTAVVLFNQNRDHTKVLQTIKAEIIKHPRYRRELRHRSESNLRYEFTHPEDANRSIFVAVLAINLPSK